MWTIAYGLSMCTRSPNVGGQLRIRSRAFGRTAILNFISVYINLVCWTQAICCMSRRGAMTLVQSRHMLTVDTCQKGTMSKVTLVHSGQLSTVGTCQQWTIGNERCKSNPPDGDINTGFRSTEFPIHQHAGLEVPRLNC